jgi:hypothetical protein
MSFLFGIIGGALGELLKWYALRESPNLPAYLRSPFYWVITVLMVLAGGVLVLVQGVSPDNPWLAVNVGLTAPLILKGFASVVPVQPPKGGNVPFTPRETPPPSPLNFIAGR